MPPKSPFDMSTTVAPLATERREDRQARATLLSVDLDARILELTSLGDEGNAFHRVYPNGPSGCLVCHERIDRQGPAGARSVLRASAPT